MGVVKAWLRDDPETAEWRNRPTAMDPVEVVTPDDPAPTTETSVNPRLAVRLRTRTGYDDDGNPEFDWTTLVEAPAILWVERKEFDAEAGGTLEQAKATLRYEGPTEVPETAMVTSDDGRRWRVLAVRQVPGSLQFEMERLT